jgi:hypothetical protein
LPGVEEERYVEVPFIGKILLSKLEQEREIIFVSGAYGKSF